MSLLEASSVGVRAGRVLLLDGVSAALPAGGVTAILGPNGAGKTTLLRVLAGERHPAAGDVDRQRLALVIQPAAGQVRLEGRPLAGHDLRALARRRALVPQHSALAFSFTAAQVVELGFALAPPSAGRGRAIVADSLSRADALHLAGRFYPTLSGGERQRVQFARALAQLAAGDHAKPQILMLDEPTASLDPAHQHQMLAAVRAWSRDQGGAAAVVLHDLTLAAAYADHFVLLKAGRRVAAGRMAALSPEMLGEAYAIRFQRLEAGDGGPPLLVARP